MIETDPLIVYIDGRIAQYKARANAEINANNPEARESYNVAAMALSVLRGNLIADLHIADPPRPMDTECEHTHEKAIGGGSYGPPGYECIDCLRVRLV